MVFPGFQPGGHQLAASPTGGSDRTVPQAMKVSQRGMPGRCRQRPVAFGPVRMSVGTIHGRKRNLTNFWASLNTLNASL